MCYIKKAMKTSTLIIFSPWGLEKLPDGQSTYFSSRGPEFDS